MSNDFQIQTGGKTLLAGLSKQGKTAAARALAQSAALDSAPADPGSRVVNISRETTGTRIQAAVINVEHVTFD